MPIRRKVIALDTLGVPDARPEPGTDFDITPGAGLYVDDAPSSARTSPILAYLDASGDPVRLVQGRAIDQPFTKLRIAHDAAHVGNLVLYSYQKGEGIYDLPFADAAAADWYRAGRYAMALRMAEGGAQTQLSRLTGDTVGPTAGLTAGAGGAAAGFYRELVCNLYASTAGGARAGNGWIIGSGPLYRTDIDPMPDSACYRWVSRVAWGAPGAGAALPNPAGVFLAPLINTGNAQPGTGGQGMGFYRLDRVLYWWNRPVWNLPADPPVVIAWPAGVDPDGWVDIEQRITLATSKAGAIYEGFVNGRRVIRKRWGIDALTDWSQNAGATLWGFIASNGSDGRAPTLYLADLIHSLGPVP